MSLRDDWRVVPLFCGDVWRVVVLSYENHSRSVFLQQKHIQRLSFDLLEFIHGMFCCAQEYISRFGCLLGKLITIRFSVPWRPLICSCFVLKRKFVNFRFVPRTDIVTSLFRATRTIH